MDIEGRYKKIGVSLESNVKDSYHEFIRGVEDYENQQGGSLSGLWDLFNPVYDALASSRSPSVPPHSSVKKEEWVRDLILAYRNINTIKMKLLDYLEEEFQGEALLDEESSNLLDGKALSPLDEL